MSQIWYCPNCGFGPLNPHIDAACPNCGWYPGQSRQAHTGECSGDECFEFKGASQHITFHGASQDGEPMLFPETASLQQHQLTSTSLVGPQSFSEVDEGVTF